MGTQMNDGPGLSALRDPRAMQAADRAGLLTAAGAAGAQVRVIGAGLPGRVESVRPRSVLVLGPTATVDAAFLTALLGRSAAAPVVAATELPAWVGPLDLVVVLPARVDDDEIAGAAATALRRGAVTVVRGPVTGPVAAAAGSALLPAEIAVPEALGTPARWALLAGVAAAAGLLPAFDPEWLADLLDAVTLAAGPVAEPFANPALNLAEHIVDGVPLFVGADPVADAVAAHAAAVFGELAGIPAASVTSGVACTSPAVLSAAGPKDIFADPYAEAGPVPRPVVINAHRTSAAQALVRALPGAWQLDGLAAAEMPDRPTLGPVGSTGEPVSSSTGPTALGAALALVVQIDLSAAFLAVASGIRLPLDHPDGLGRSGGGRWAARTATVGGEAPGVEAHDEDGDRWS